MIIILNYIHMRRFRLKKKILYCARYAYILHGGYLFNVHFTPFLDAYKVTFAVKFINYLNFSIIIRENVERIEFLFCINMV